MAYNVAANADVLTTWLNKRFISDLDYELQHQKFTEKAIIPSQSGNVGRFLHWNLPSAATTNLAEGTTTEGEVTFTGTGVDITVVEWGQHLKTTELMMYAAVKGAREKLSKRLRDGAALTIDTRVAAVAATSTTAAYCIAGEAGAQTAAATPTAGNAAALIFAKKILKNNKAMGFEGISGHPDRHFAAVVSATYEQQMVQEATAGRLTFSEINKYNPGQQAQTKLVNGFLGSVYGVAVYVTNNFTQTTVTSLADNNYVFADGGVGAMAFGDMQPQIIINEVNSPYKNINSIAWHVMFQAGLVSSARVLRLYSLA